MSKQWTDFWSLQYDATVSAARGIACSMLSCSALMTAPVTATLWNWSRMRALTWDANKCAKTDVRSGERIKAELTRLPCRKSDQQVINHSVEWIVVGILESCLHRKFRYNVHRLCVIRAGHYRSDMQQYDTDRHSTSGLSLTGEKAWVGWTLAVDIG